MTARLYPAQAVLPGHPDKLCDAVADALVQQAAVRDPLAYCRVQASLDHDKLHVFGRLAGAGVEAIDARSVIHQVYHSAGIDPEHLNVAVDLSCGSATEREQASRSTAEDQAIVTGYAVDLPGMHDLPAEHWLVVQLLRRLDALRTSDPILGLGHGGELVVLVEEDEEPTRLAGFSITVPHLASGLPLALEKGVKKVLADELAHLSRRGPLGLRCASAGIAGGQPRCGARHAAGWPEWAAWAQRRLWPACAGGHGWSVRQGFLPGGTSGAADRSAVARAVVRTGVARECLATLALVPGQTEAQILQLRGDGQVLDVSRWATLLDRSLAGTGKRFTGREALVDVARYGHFTGERAWERLHFDDRV